MYKAIDAPPGVFSFIGGIRGSLENVCRGRCSGVIYGRNISAQNERTDRGPLKKKISGLSVARIFDGAYFHDDKPQGFVRRFNRGR